jgi:hypothetical protein
LNSLSDQTKEERENQWRLAQRERETEREIAGNIEKGANQSPVEQQEVVWHRTIKPWTDHPKAGNMAKEKRGP